MATKARSALRRLRLRAFSDSLHSWRSSSSHCSTRFASSSGHARRCTWRTSALGSSRSHTSTGSTTVTIAWRPSLRSAPRPSTRARTSLYATRRAPWLMAIPWTFARATKDSMRQGATRSEMDFSTRVPESTPDRLCGSDRTPRTTLRVVRSVRPNECMLSRR